MFSQVLLLLSLAFALLAPQADASSWHGRGGSHQVFHKLHHRSNATANSTSTNSSATGLLAEALARIAVANKRRLENPRFNANQFPPENRGPENATLPPIISVTNSSRLLKRDNDTSDVPTDYSIPPELLKAAREATEATKHEIDVDQAEADELKAKYWTPTNDTNTPEPASKPLNDLGDLPGLTKRDSSFWMESMNMNGFAPYAGSATYKVFRNVKDYGAMGDGIHDDTEAINNAITDGGRCGETCGSSTGKPAVIYFPAGSYLVSSSIIQYYNTQFLGDPTNRPRIVASQFFVGLGVLSSNVYIEGGNGSSWYIPQSNFLRSIRNFVIDIRNSPPDNYVCGIHWQVAQGTDLQNIDFLMKDGTTQQGIWMENGSGGFLTDLLFQGGNFGAYLGNQQFTSRNLLFYECQTAIQIHWDWAWTMKGVSVLGRGWLNQPSTGISIVGGAGGPGSTGQGVGSFVLLDSKFDHVSVAIDTTLLAENSTSLLLQNVQFQAVDVPVRDSATGTTMLSASQGLNSGSWGFGRVVAGNNGTSVFSNGGPVAMMSAPRSLYVFDKTGGRWYARSAPTYRDQQISAFINVKSFGAKGDGQTDDTAILNQLMAVAANSSRILFFPYGMYMVSDTVYVPLGSRIVGQVWPQIVGFGPKFSDMLKPHPVVKVGRPGDAGVVEISDMMISVKGGTAGAVLMEWNIHEGTAGDMRGSAAIWNTHLRVGGNVGSSLQAANCPKLSGSVNPNCIAASLLMHLTPQSSAYVENLWAWVADHDLDIPEQTQIDIYSGRGILIESQGPTWLWGTASEHSVMYQYQLSGAKDVFASMFQTETPYFQPTPKAPAPFKPGIFPNDPDFAACDPQSARCAMSWALRILDSSSVYAASLGFYSWFNSYSQACVDTEDCQDRGVDVQNSVDVWLYALTTKAIIEMVSPVKVTATLARNNRNGFLSSVLAWLEGSTKVSGGRFPGWALFRNGSLSGLGLSSACENAMYQTVKCDISAKTLLSKSYQGNVQNVTRLGEMCDPGCVESIKFLRGSVELACAATPNLKPGFPFLGFVDLLYSHWNETCFKDPSSGRFCDDVMSGFSKVSEISQMPRAEMCSYCHLQKFKLMQESAFSFYDNDTFEARYKYVANACQAPVTAFDPAPNGFTPNVTIPQKTCVSGIEYVASAGDTCDSIAIAKKVSSAALWWNNPTLHSCSSIPAGEKLCLPLACETIHTVTTGEACLNISLDNSIFVNDLIAYNPGIAWDCGNLHNASVSWGTTLCVSPPGGQPIHNSTGGNPNPWGGGDGYAEEIVPLPAGASLASGTTLECGGWYEHANAGMGCTKVVLDNHVLLSIFIEVNPSLHEAMCDEDLVVGKTYCVHPLLHWKAPPTTITRDPPISTSTTTAATTTSSSLSTTSSTTSTTTSTSSSSSSPSSVPTGDVYHGCYTEGVGVKALKSAKSVNATAMTPALCSTFCAAYAYYGVEYGSECYCGDSLGAGSMPIFAAQCSSACPGNSALKCGGGNRLSLYGHGPAGALPPPTTPAPGTPAVSSYAYVGCFTEATGTRTLGKASVADSTEMTVAACARFCIGSGWPMFGLESARECWCGSERAAGSAAAPETECNMACTGNAVEKCGGRSRLSVWLWT